MKPSGSLLTRMVDPVVARIVVCARLWMTVGATVGATLTPVLLTAQRSAVARGGTAVRPSLRAVYSGTDPVLDGLLNDAVWATAPVATDFTQRVPRGGAAASQRTQVRVAYDAQAMYVGVRNWDTAPDSIAQQLGRRDADDIFSDWFFVGFDSYGDRRTAFVFGVSPRGVLRDQYLSNDGDFDDSWDAVWNVVSRVDSAGWTAEFRIPLSQLRYDVRGTVGAVRPWGINFSREIARHGEESFWADTPANAAGFASRFGTLTGLDSLRPPSRNEVVPYVRSQIETQPRQNQNQFVPARAATIAVGGDVRLKLPQSLTLTATLNPDFGQVEADPAVVNLSAFEVFFDERRPFFLENADGFGFGRTRTSNDNDPPTFFYSRRIGRAPQRAPGGRDLLAVGIASRTPIAGALKLSGTTPSGWQIGVLNGVTPHEHAEVLREGDLLSREPVEPRSNYHVTRVRRLLRGGNTGIGAFVADTRRALDDSLLRVRLASSATVTGIDWEHAWQERMWTISGVYAQSAVRGDSQVIARLQRANYRSFHRPDAAHLAFDPARTALGGSYSAFSLAKSGGERVLASVTYEQTSPGLEVNDLGFQVRSDVRSVSTSLQYRDPLQSRWSRDWSMSVFGTLSDNYGGDRVEERYTVFGSTTLHNFWEIEVNGNISPQTLNDRLLRGGPLAQRPASSRVSFELSTDGRLPVILSVEGNVGSDVSGLRTRELTLGFDWRPLPQARLRLEPVVGSARTNNQYIQSVPDGTATATSGARYVFANVQQHEVRMDTRLDWTFSPWLSLQLFLQPFASAGRFTRLKEFTTPRAFRFAEYGVDAGTLKATADGVVIDPDGAGAARMFTVPAQDFTVRALRGNAVLRWEYRPGSSVFLVWSQQREQALDDARFNVGGQLARAFADPGQQVFLVKFSRWLGR